MNTPTSPAPIDRLADWIGQSIVIDCESPFVILGKLTAVDDRTLLLQEVDVHDLRDATVTRELYLLESRRHGINVNRRQAFVQRSQVVSVSLFDEIVI